MRILHYCKEFSPLTQTFIYDMVLQLDELGVSNTVVTHKIVNREERPYKDVIQFPSFKTSVFNKAVFKALSILGLYQYDRKKEELNFLKKICKKQTYQIIHSHFGTAGFKALPIAKDQNIPLIVSFHGFDAFRLPKEKLWEEKIQNVLQGATYIIVVSSMMKETLMSLGCAENKIKIIHVGKKIEDYPFSYRTNTPPRNFISIGRLTEKKGHLFAIKAFQGLLKKYPDLYLNIVGEGPLFSVLDNYISSNGLQTNIKLLGSLSHQETKDRLAVADAFILCSVTAADGDQEGIPTVLMEAQALGLPCISTIHSGIPEVFPLENQWLLAEEGNIASISEKIEDLINATKESLDLAVNAGRKKIEDEFNLETEVQKLKKVYGSLLN